MPELHAFRGIRYSPEIDLSLVTSPPYDVITDEERSRLAERHPKNFVNLIVPRVDKGEDRYRAAAETLRSWLREKTLVRDARDSFYIYRSDYLVGDREPRSTAGVIAALKLEEFGKGAIFPHERTMAGPKADRLELMRHTDANLEPLWFVSATHVAAINELVERAAETDPLADLSDPQGVKHRLWRVSPATAEQVVAELGHGKLVIADGHHRYETALAYRDQLRSRGPGPWDYTLALIVDPLRLGPTLLPIHRVAHGLSLADLSDVVPLEPFQGNLEGLQRHVEAGAPNSVGVISISGLYTLRADGPIPSAFLDAEIFERAHAKVAYEHDLKHLERAVETGALGFVLSPVEVSTVIDFALAGRRMPPKTTLFWPKPRSGLVVRDISIGNHG